MDEFSTIDLLEATHTFPGPYMFKAIGRSENGFIARVIAAVREELAHSDDPPYRLRHTGKGDHVAVTVEPHVESPYEVLAVYRRLGKIAGLVMLW